MVIRERCMGQIGLYLLIDEECVDGQQEKKREAEDFLRDTNELTRKKSLLWQFHMYTLRNNLDITTKTMVSVYGAERHTACDKRSCRLIANRCATSRTPLRPNSLTSKSKMRATLPKSHLYKRITTKKFKHTRKSNSMSTSYQRHPRNWKRKKSVCLRRRNT